MKSQTKLNYISSFHSDKADLCVCTVPCTWKRKIMKLLLCGSIRHQLPIPAFWLHVQYPVHHCLLAIAYLRQPSVSICKLYYKPSLFPGGKRTRVRHRLSWMGRTARERPFPVQTGCQKPVPQRTFCDYQLDHQLIQRQLSSLCQPLTKEVQQSRKTVGFY